MQQGRKFDGGKLRYDLVPVLAYEEVTKVLTAGSLKYDDNNWQKVPKGRQRYLAAALRHIQDYRKGHVIDDGEGGTNTHTLANAITDLMFILEKDLQGWPDEEEVRNDEPQPVKYKVADQFTNPGPDVYEIGPIVEWSPKPWYPDDSGEWVELPPDNASIPFDLHHNDVIEVLYLYERENQEWHEAYDYVRYWDWSKRGSMKIVAYKKTRKFKEN